MNFFPTFVIPLERLSCCHHSVQICGKVAFTCTGKLAIILNPEVTTASVQTTPFPSPPATVAGGCYYEVNASKKEMKPNKACECEFFQPVFGTLLLLSSFSRVRLCVTPWTTAYQASLSMGFSRQEHWSGLPFPSPHGATGGCNRESQQGAPGGGQGSFTLRFLIGDNSGNV